MKTTEQALTVDSRFELEMQNTIHVTVQNSLSSEWDPSYQHCFSHKVSLKVSQEYTWLSLNHMQKV